MISQADKCIRHTQLFRDTYCMNESKASYTYLNQIEQFMYVRTKMLRGNQQTIKHTSCHEIRTSVLSGIIGPTIQKDTKIKIARRLNSYAKCTMNCIETVSRYWTLLRLSKRNVYTHTHTPPPIQKYIKNFYEEYSGALRATYSHLMRN